MTKLRGLRRILGAVALLAAELFLLASPAVAESPDQACRALYQRRNQDYCRSQLAQNQWPCTALPVQDLQDLKNCAELFDFNAFTNAQAKLAAQSKPASPPQMSPPAPSSAPPPEVHEATTEIVPLQMVDREIALREAAQKASIERQRVVEEQRLRIASRLGVDPQVRDARPPADEAAPAREVMQLYAELQHMQQESDRLAQEIKSQNEALAAARKQRDDLQLKSAATPAAKDGDSGRMVGALLLATGALILAGLVGGILFWRHRQGAGGEATRIYPASGVIRSGGAPYKDCMLEGGDGASLLLIGSLLPEGAGGVVVGRHGAQAQVIIERPEISRRHARFTVRDGALGVEDLGSANGTSVDGTPVRAGERRVVSNGARIQFGPLIYTLRVAS